MPIRFTLYPQQIPFPIHEQRAEASLHFPPEFRKGEQGERLQRTKTR